MYFVNTLILMCVSSTTAKSFQSWKFCSLALENCTSSTFNLHETFKSTELKFTVSGHKETSKQANIYMHVCTAILLVWGLLRLTQNSLYQVVLLIAPLPTSIELAVPSSADQAGLLLPAVSPQQEGDLQRMQTWELSGQSGRRVKDNKHWNNHCCLLKQITMSVVAMATWRYDRNSTSRSTIIQVLQW